MQYVAGGYGRQGMKEVARGILNRTGEIKMEGKVISQVQSEAKSEVKFATPPDFCI